MTDERELIAKFLERLEKLELRYKGAKYKHVTAWLIPRDELTAVEKAIRRNEKPTTTGRRGDFNG